MGDILPSYLGALGALASNTTDTEPDTPGEKVRNWSSLIGIVTAIVGNVLIALALNVQRYAHIRLHRERLRTRQRARLAERRAKYFSQFNLAGYGSVGGNGSPTDMRVTNGGAGERVEGGHGADESSASSPTSFTRDHEDDQPLPASYLKSTYWWLGQILITLGEMGNFLAYGFAPASIVSPLGVVALVSNCIIAPIFFNEKFRQRDFWGVAVAVSGAVTVVLSANQQETKLEPHDVWKAITTLAFEIYMGVTGLLIIFLMWVSSTCANRTILVDLGLVGLFGGYTALATKGVSSMLSATLWRAFTTPVTYALLLVLLLTAVLQIRYVNKALQRYDSTEVIPIQFVTFTLCVIIGSAVLYRDFERTTLEQAAKFVGGCLLTFFGVFLITSGRPPRDDEEYFAEFEDDEEVIGLLDHDRSQGPERASETPLSIRSRRSSRSSRSSHINFPEAFIKPFSIQHDSGVPTLRMPTSSGAKFMSNDGGPQVPGVWTAANYEDAAEADQRTASAPDMMPQISRQNSATSGVSFAEPSTPRATALVPFASESQATTPRPSTAKLHARHLNSPLISPSPLSSTVSAVVKDTLRRHGENPILPNSSLSRIRSSIRASLYMSDDDEAHGRGALHRVAPDSREPLLGDLTDVEDGGTPAVPGDRQATKDARRRTRSLSDTLGELFSIKKRKMNDDRDHGGDTNDES